MKKAQRQKTPEWITADAAKTNARAEYLHAETAHYNAVTARIKLIARITATTILGTLGYFNGPSIAQSILENLIHQPAALHAHATPTNPTASTALPTPPQATTAPAPTALADSQAIRPAAARPP